LSSAVLRGGKLLELTCCNIAGGGRAVRRKATGVGADLILACEGKARGINREATRIESIRNTATLLATLLWAWLRLGYWYCRWLWLRWCLSGG
jgi:hypothetical protein